MGPPWGTTADHDGDRGLEVPGADDDRCQPEDENGHPDRRAVQRAHPRDRQGDMPEHDQDAPDKHRPVRADEFVSDDPPDDRHEIGQARIPPVERASRGVRPPRPGVEARDLALREFVQPHPRHRRGEIEHQQRPHAVVAKPLPHLDQKQQEQPRRVPQERPLGGRGETWAHSGIASSSCQGVPPARGQRSPSGVACVFTGPC